jgi:hypothetical protein
MINVFMLSLLTSFYFSWKEMEPLDEFIYRFFCTFLVFLGIKFLLF